MDVVVWTLALLAAAGAGYGAGRRGRRCAVTVAAGREIAAVEARDTALAELADLRHQRDVLKARLAARDKALGEAIARAEPTDRRIGDAEDRAMAADLNRAALGEIVRGLIDEWRRLGTSGSMGYAADQLEREVGHLLMPARHRTLPEVAAASTPDAETVTALGGEGPEGQR